jgi:hypothetical protein
METLDITTTREWHWIIRGGKAVLYDVWQQKPRAYTRKQLAYQIRKERKRKYSSIYHTLNEMAKWESGMELMKRSNI